MIIKDILELKFPTIFPDVGQHTTVRLDATNNVILQWDISICPTPTATDIAQWEQEVQPLYDAQQFKSKNRVVLDQLDAIDLKTIRALREGDQVRIQQLADQANELRKGLVK